MSPPSRNVGTLQSRSLTDILLWIKSNAYTGVVVLAHEQIKKSILVESGKIVAVRSNVAQETLVQILLNSQKIQSNDLKSILDKIENKEAYHQGEELMKAGLIDATTLYQTIQLQMEMRVLEIFDWPDGKFGIVPDFPEQTIKVPMDKSIPELLFRGLLKKHGKDPNGSKNAGQQVPVKNAIEGITDRELKLLGKEQGVYRSINGVLSVEHLAKQQSMTNAQVVPILQAFVELGLVKMIEPVKEAVKIVEIPKPTNLIGDLKKRFEDNRKKDFYEILGVGKKADEKEIKSAYFELAKKYHPDRISQQLSGDDKKYVEDYFSLITQAHNTLSNANLRKEYEASLAVENTGITVQQAEKILQSEMLFQKSLLMLKKSHYDEVIKFMQEAISMYDEEPEYKLVLGWAMFRDGSLKKNAVSQKKGKDLVKFAMEKNPRLQGYYYLGMIEKSEGRDDAALKHFEKAVEQNANHTDAANEIRVIAMKGSKKESKGILGMFGKKK